MTRVVLVYNGNTHLEILEENLGLAKTIEYVKEKLQLPNQASDYGLQVFNSASETNSQEANCYITDDDISTKINNGAFIKVTYSARYFLAEILKNIRKPERMEMACKTLYDLAADIAFIKEIVNCNVHEKVTDFLHNYELNENGQTGCLLVILQLLKEGYINTINEKTLKKIIQIINEGRPNMQYAVSVILQILYCKKPGFQELKSHILKEIKIFDLIPFLRDKAKASNFIELLNAFIRLSKKEDHQAKLIKQLNLKENREIVFKYICESNIPDDVGRRLYVYQSYLLSPYRNPLNTITSSLNLDSGAPKHSMDNLSMLQLSMIEETENESKISKLPNYLEDSSRYSILSIDTRGSFESDSTTASELFNNNITMLTHNCIQYYKEKYFVNFTKSQAEENSYEPGICKSSDRMINIIAEELNINGKRPGGNKNYVPIFFNPETTLFIEELYTGLMFLLSKARREMKVKKMEDYEKVIGVVKKQFSIILERKPKSFREFWIHVGEVSYNTVKKFWENERKAKWYHMLKNNKCLQDIYTKVMKDNEEVLFQQRIGILKAGALFPKLPEKKNSREQVYNKLQISATTNQIYFGEWCNIRQNFKNKQTFYFNKIKYCVTGEACTPIKEKTVIFSKKDCIFSLVLEDKSEIHCLAANVKTANYWIDGFNLLLGLSHRSTDYKTELEQLSHVDYSIQMIELQNINVPMDAPPLPPEIDFTDVPNLEMDLEASDTVDFGIPVRQNLSKSLYIADKPAVPIKLKRQTSFQEPF